MASTAFFWGIISAISLPLGAFIGCRLRPGRKANSILMAFGGGALLFALTIELFAHVPHHVEIHGNPMIWVVVSCAMLGGLLFSGLNAILNNYGAFMRRLSAARLYLERVKHKRSRRYIKQLSAIRVLNELPPELMAELIHEVELMVFEDGENIFKQGDSSDWMYFIVDGNVDIVYHDGDEPRRVNTLDKYDSFGEVGVLSGRKRSADAVANGPVQVYAISRDDFENLVHEDRLLYKKIIALATSRLADLSVKTSHQIDSEAWRDETLKIYEQGQVSVTHDEIMEEGEVRSRGKAALAIWLGIFIDGIPESLVIGMLAVSATGVSMAFIAGVFLANLPEAISSSMSMRDSGLGMTRVYLMWGSITLVTGIGAALGAMIFPSDPQGMAIFFKVGIEAIAAGAMLTMIAETMMPEAFEMGGPVVGLATLVGFLAALMIKII
jgi:CRP-like cAMP-binding protein